MSIAFVAFCLRRELAKLTAVVLSTWIGVGGCGWPISSRQMRRGMASLAERKAEPISASAAELITFFMILESTWITPLERGMEGFEGSGKASPRK